MWPSQEYLWQQWPMGAAPAQFYGAAAANPPPQDTDPGEWAMKAAQWAQQRQIQEQAFQQMSQWQQPQTLQVHPPQQVVDHQELLQPSQFAQQSQEYRQPPPSVVPSQEQMFLQQQVPPSSQAPSQPLPLMGNIPQQSLGPPSEDERRELHLEQFEQPVLDDGRGQGEIGEGRRFGGEEMYREFRPRGGFGGRGRGASEFDFQSRGGGYPQAEFRYRGPRGGQGGPRFRGTGRHAGLGYPPPRKGPNWGLQRFSPPKEGVGQPASPTELYFKQEEEAGRDNRAAPDYNYSGDYSHTSLQPSQASSFEGPERGREVRMTYKKEEKYVENQFRDVVVKKEKEDPFERKVGKATERLTDQEYISELEQLGEEMAAREEEEEEWRKRQEQDYDLLNSRGQFSAPMHVEAESTKMESFPATSTSLSGLTSVPPSSLSKGPSVIPGFGEFVKEAPAKEPLSVGGASSQPKEETPQPQSGLNQTNQMMESLGKIVSQLQTLQGLTSSLQLLQNLPKGSGGPPEGGASTEAGGEAERAKAGRTGAETAQKEREIELSEETKRKVAALLANDSDSDGEQGTGGTVDRGGMGTRPKEPPKAQAPMSSSEGKEPSPPAREFDGTFNVKPQVYGTYESTQKRYAHPEGEYRGTSESGEGEGERGREYRHPNYDYPPSARDHDRERPQGYEYEYPRRPPPPGSRDYPYPPGRERPLPPPHPSASSTALQFESRDYGHGRPPYEGSRDYQGGPPHPYEGHYDYPRPPPPESIRGPPPPSHEHPPPPREEDRYYSSGKEKEKSTITSHLETIDYSHGGGLAVQSVDYHHGQPGSSDRHEEPGYRTHPPRMDDYPAGPPSRYDSYPPPPGYGQMRGYPTPYSEGFPHPYPPYGGGAAAFLPPGLDPASLFAAYTGQTGETKRKALPLWLREALEKMERDKQKKQEKTSKEGTKSGDSEGGGRPTWREEMEMEDEEKEGNDRDWEEPGGRLKRSYRFRSKSPHQSDSDSEDRSPPRRRKKRGVSSIGVEEEEERQLGLIMRIRKMLTEILLEVTNKEIAKVAGEAIEEAKNPMRVVQVKNQQKTPSNILAGLNMYTSDIDSEEEEVEEEEKVDQRSSRSKAKSRSPKPSKFGPVLDPMAIAAAFMDSFAGNQEQERDKGKVREKSKERERSREGAKEKRKEKERERSSSRKDSTSEKSDKKSSEEGGRSRGDGKSSTREKAKEKESSKKRASNSTSSNSSKKEKGKDKKANTSKSSSGSSSKQSSSSSTLTSSKSKKRSPSPSASRPLGTTHSSATSSKHKSSSSKARSRSRSPSKSSSKSSSVKDSKSTSAAKKSSSSLSSERATHSSSSSESGRKRPRRHSRSRSPSPIKERGRGGGRIVQERIVEERGSSRTRSRSRSRSQSPSGVAYSKWSSSFSSPSASTDPPATKSSTRFIGFSNRPFWNK